MKTGRNSYGYLLKIGLVPAVAVTKQALRTLLGIHVKLDSNPSNFRQLRRGRNSEVLEDPYKMKTVNNYANFSILRLAQALARFRFY